MSKALERRAKLRESLVEAAEGSITARGVAGLKTRELAREIGCANGAVYNLVADIDELILRVGSRTLGRLDASHLDNDVAVLDVNRKGFGHIGPLGQRLAVLDHNRIGPHLDAVRIEIRLPGAHVELPAMPGAAQQFADAGTLVDPGLRRGQPRDACRLVERRAFVGTAIEQREELAIEMEHDGVPVMRVAH